MRSRHRVDHAIAGLVLGLLILPTAPTRDGKLDPTFGHKGRVFTPAGGNSANDVALQSDGKIVAVGAFSRVQGGMDNFLVVRYLPDGRLDPGFGEGGMVITDFGPGRSDARGVVIQGDGRIVAAGTILDQNAIDDKFALARYLPDGTLDPTFGGDGMVAHRVESEQAAVWGLAIQADGRIVAAGYARPAPATTDFALARYLPNGRLDRTFDSDGMLITRFDEGDASARGLAIQLDGRIVAAGHVALPVFSSGFALARYTVDGRLDPTFGGDGTVATAFPSGYASGLDLALQADGRMVVAGSAPVPDGSSGGFALARYLSDGDLDESFGTGGLVTTEFPRGRSGARSVAIDAEGRIVAAGNARATDQPELRSDFGVARYLSDGTLDPSFGRDGLVITSMGETLEIAHDVAIQPDGKVVASGTGGSQEEDTVGFALARYEGG